MFECFVYKCYLSYYFTKLSQVHLGPCTCRFFLRLARLSDGLHDLILRFPERPFLGLVDEATPFPETFTRLPERLAYDRWVFYFYEGAYYNTLDI